jgi:hypothetical protein
MLNKLIFDERSPGEEAEREVEVGDKPGTAIDEISPDEDERQAMQSLRAPKEAMEVVREHGTAIDEISPDEDERQAMQSLRAPKRSASNRVVRSGES